MASLWCLYFAMRVSSPCLYDQGRRSIFLYRWKKFRSRWAGSSLHMCVVEWRVGGGACLLVTLAVISVKVGTRGSKGDSLRGNVRRFAGSVAVNKAVHSGCRCRARRKRKQFRIHATHVGITKGMAPRMDCGTRVSLYSRNGVGVLSTCAHVGP